MFQFELLLCCTFTNYEATAIYRRLLGIFQIYKPPFTYASCIGKVIFLLHTFMDGLFKYAVIGKTRQIAVGAEILP